MSTALPAYALVTITMADPTGAGPVVLRSGKLISDAATSAAYLAGGGQLGANTDPQIIAAAAIVVKMRNRGSDELLCDRVMIAAAASDVTEELTFNTPISLTAASSTVQPDPLGKSGTVSAAGLFLTPPVTGGVGESAVFQLKKNGTNVTGATVTLSATTLANVPVAIPSTAGLAYLATDVLTFANTYTAGTPAYTGLSAQLTGVGG